MNSKEFFRFHQKNQIDTLDLMSGIRKFILLDLAIACSADNVPT